MWSFRPTALVFQLLPLTVPHKEQYICRVKYTVTYKEVEEAKRPDRDARDVQRMLTNPAVAFDRSWMAEKAVIGKAKGLLFSGALLSSCAGKEWHTMASLDGDPQSALPEYFGSLRTLVDSWRSVAPDSAAWCELNPELFSRAQQAHLARRSALVIPDLLSRSVRRSASPFRLTKSSSDSKLTCRPHLLPPFVFSRTFWLIALAPSTSVQSAGGPS